MIKINGKTECLAIIGDPIGHSLSPIMQNLFLQYWDLNCVYIPCQVAKRDLKEAIMGLYALGFKGANITIPHKEGVIPYLSGLSSQAQLIGAVNTLVRKEDGFWGENTDGQGLLEALAQEKGWQPRNKKIVILGAGGSAKAVAVSLALAGAGEISIINRNLAKAETITEITAGKIGVSSRSYSWNASDIKKIVNAADIIINTIPLGMVPRVDDLPPINIDYLQAGQLVVDLIYNPLETKLLKKAKEQGCDICNGLGMLIHQGILAFQLWTGKEPPQEGIREKLEQYLNN